VNSSAAFITELGQIQTKHDDGMI